MYTYSGLTHIMRRQTPREGSPMLNTRNNGHTDNTCIPIGIQTNAGVEGKTIGRREIFALGIFNGQLNAYDKNVCIAAAAECVCTLLQNAFQGPNCDGGRKSLARILYVYVLVYCTLHAVAVYIYARALHT